MRSKYSENWGSKDESTSEAKGINNIIPVQRYLLYPEGMSKLEKWFCSKCSF